MWLHTLFLGTNLPKGCLHSLSGLESKAMDIAVSMAGGINSSSTYLAADSLILVERKTIPPQPCTDVWGLNNITIKNKHLYLLYPPAFELLHQAAIFKLKKCKIVYATHPSLINTCVPDSRQKHASGHVEIVCFCVDDILIEHLKQNNRRHSGAHTRPATGLPILLPFSCFIYQFDSLLSSVSCASCSCQMIFPPWKLYIK